jgi:hypothetical protein
MIDILVKPMNWIFQYLHFRHKVNDRKLIKFVEFVKNKKNLKNNLAVENMFFHRFNYYIPYNILNKLLKYENPTGLILNYIDSSKFLMFHGKELVFREFYFLKSHNRRKIFFSLKFSIGVISLVIAFFSLLFFGIELQSDETKMDSAVYFLMYTLVFFYGFILATQDSIRLKIAMDLVEDLKK